jgi:PHD/YefM family antitoxin component YafN of YafNO toxin-antitoxin module
MKRTDSVPEARRRLFAMIDKVHEANRDVPVEVIEANVAEAIRKIRGANAVS